MREDYSGRGMNCKTTCAVTLDSQGEFQEALVEAAHELGRIYDEPGEVNHDVRLALQKGFATDGMGLGIVVY